MNEHSFIKSVHRKLPTSMVQWKIHDTFTGGVPDVMYGGPSGILFVEYKYIPKLPVRETTVQKTSLRPLQIQWLNKMVGCCQKAALIIGVEDYAVILLAKEWTANITRSYYISHKIPRGEVSAWRVKQCM